MQQKSLQIWLKDILSEKRYVDMLTKELLERYFKQFNEIKQRLVCRKPEFVHFVGICGVGMASLAFHLRRLGYKVSGCDVSINNTIGSWLISNGIEVFEGHLPEHLTGVDWLVVSSAIKDDNPEIVFARMHNKPYYKRGIVLAAITSLEKSVIVCGSHGKTTTTAMLATIMKKMEANVAFSIGGEVQHLAGVAGFIENAAKTNFFIAEADESDGTLVCYEPYIAIVTNLEFDHAESFASIEELKRCFSLMLDRVKGYIVYNIDDSLLQELCGSRQKSISFGFSDEADWQIFDVKEGTEFIDFSLKNKVDVDKKLLIRANCTGLYNVKNAAAACTAGLALNIDDKRIEDALLEFKPVKRRFEIIFSKPELKIITDYAHHPTEIRNFLSAALKLPHRRVTAIFQPHRYSRTKALLSEFAEVFTGVDELVLLPVYSASEIPIDGGYSEDLYEIIRKKGFCDLKMASSYGQVVSYIGFNKAASDLVLFIGAGDVDKAARELADALYTDKFSRYDNKINILYEKALSLGGECVVKLRQSLAKKTTLQVGGEVDIYIEVLTLNALLKLMKIIVEHDIRYTFLGGGSNVLFSDFGFRGAVLKLGGEFSNFKWLDETRCCAGAGVPLARLIEESVNARKAGFEFLTGIPGTLGGALYGNAGAFGSSIADRVCSVKVLIPPAEQKEFTRDQLLFGYRASPTLKGMIVLGAILKVKGGSESSREDQLTEYRKKKEWLVGKKTAGSIFKNPDKAIAGRLLEQCGFKGYTVGGAKVSEYHANVIENTGSATASDILVLINKMEHKVYHTFNVKLESEVIYFE